MDIVESAFDAGFGIGGKLSAKEEKKRKRLERIEKRLEEDAIEKGTVKDPSKARNAEEAISMDKQQLADSTAYLDKRKLAGIEEVTEIRTEVDFRENRRRIKDDANCQERLEMLQVEAIESGKANAEIEMKWAELLELNMPDVLHKEMKAQQAICAEIINSKDNLIKDFRKQLKLKDEEFVKSLKRYENDSTELLNRTKKEIVDLQDSYEAEIASVENAHEAERANILSKNRSKIESLLELRKSKEIQYSKAKQAQDEKYHREIEDLLTEDTEEYNKLKIKLEGEIMTSEQSLEEVKASYQLNTEKLEYNYKVLTERDLENSNTLTNMKKRVNRLRDALSNILSKYQENDTREKKRNELLTEEFRRLTINYRELQGKFRHFESVECSRFEKVWAMHEDEIRSKIESLLRADELIHSQVLGLVWREPNLETLYEETAAMADQNSEPAGKNMDDESVRNKSQNANGGEEKDEEEEEEEILPPIDPTRLQSMLTLLLQETGFILDNGSKRTINSIYNTNDGNEEKSKPIRGEEVEELLKALGVTSEDDLRDLMEVLSRVDSPFDKLNTDDSNNNMVSATSDKSGDDKDVNDSTTSATIQKAASALVHPDQVITTLQAFVEAKKEGVKIFSKKLGSMSKGSEEDKVGDGSKQNKKIDSSLTDAIERKVNKDQKAREGFWRKLQNVIPEHHFRAWDQLDVQLGKYSKLLAERKNMADDIDNLREQNMELRTLLSAYLTDSINDELIIAPKHQISFASS